MKINSIEPTPNPNSMKLNMDEQLASGMKLYYTSETAANAPHYLQLVLQIKGVKSVYQITDFIALERHPKADWQDILTEVREVLEQVELNPYTVLTQSEDTQGQQRVHVFVQFFREVPMQIKLLTATEDIRVALPERFKIAAKQAAMYTQHFLTERMWVDRGFQNGDPTSIGEKLHAEIANMYDEQCLQRLVESALLVDQPNTPDTANNSLQSVQKQLESDDWKIRYAALEHLEPSEELMPLLAKVLKDPKPTIRRLATVYFGTLGDLALPYLYEALRDSSASVRRAAGDCLSDIGNPQAISDMVKALRDPSKLVRWRAARFLYEVGNVSALPALQAAKDDQEFEVRMQVQMAIERIEGGHEAQGPVWQQITKRLSE